MFRLFCSYECSTVFSRQMNTVSNMTVIRHLLFTKKHLTLLSLGIYLKYLYFHSCKIQVAWVAVECAALCWACATTWVHNQPQTSGSKIKHVAAFC